MTSRPNDPKEKSSEAPVEDGWDDVVEDDKETRPRGTHTLPIGTPKPPLLRNPGGGQVVPGQKVSTLRLPMESAIELDDDALMEVEEDAPILVSPPAPPASPPVPPSARRPSISAGAPRPETIAPGQSSYDDELVAELDRRAKELEDRDVPVALSRARVELGIVLEVLSCDRDEALAQYQRALEASPESEAPLLAARWLTPQRPLAPALKLALAHARIARDDGSRVERAVQVAELHRSAGMLHDARKAYRQALSIKPTHVAALRGQEAVLQGMFRSGALGIGQGLASHLEDMASAFGNESSFSAWLQVERAALLDAEGKHDAARAALELAMKLDGDSPAVRDAYTRHLLICRSTDALVEAWSCEAQQESDGARAARYEYAAARLASERLDDVNLAIQLHSRAAARNDAHVDVRRGALQELARLHTDLGNPRAASEAKERHLALVEDPQRRCHEHRKLSETYELLGRHEDVVRHLLKVLESDPGDSAAQDRMDRAFDALERHEARIERWISESARLSQASDRAIALVRAARIAEFKLLDLARAESLYRSAWASDSSNVDAFDGLSRLLARPVNQPVDLLAEGARARIDLYEQAASAATDKERRMACLQKVAQIWEDEVRQPARALEVYRRLSDLDDQRRSTILGLQRCAAMALEYDLLIRSLVREAETVHDAALQRSLLLRAANLAAEELNDAEMAMGFIGRVLARSPGDPMALRAAWHVNHKTGRYEQALGQLRLLLKHTRRGPSAFALCVEMALLLEEQLRRPEDAVRAYREAAEQDPEQLTPSIEIPRILVGLGEFRKAAEQLMDLASQTSNPYVRTRLLVQAADIFHDRLDDLDAALLALTQAYGLSPADVSIFERIVRVQERRGKATELVPLLDKRIVSSEGDRKLKLQFQLAELLAREKDFARASKLLETFLSAVPGHVAALRLQEQALRRLERWEDLSALLHQQAGSFSDPAVRLGALFEARYLEELGGEVDKALATLERIREILPEDPHVYEAILRSGGLSGQQQPLRILADALGSLAAIHRSDPFLAATMHLAAALQFEALGVQEDASATPKALSHFQACLEHWSSSLTAARGLLRVAQTLGNLSAETEAHQVLSRVEAAAGDRAAHAADAANSLANTGQPGCLQALDLYRNALDDDPNCGSAARGIVALVDRGIEPGRVVDILRPVLDRAHDPDQVVFVGGALGRIARDHLRDLNGSIDALRKVRERCPGHVLTLLDLAEACVSLRLWFEAAEVAQSVLGISHDRTEHIQALLILAESHAQIQSKSADARREAVDAELAAEALPLEERREAIARLARVYETLNDPVEQERLICINVALAGADPNPLRQLASRHDLSTVDGCIAYIQSVNRVIGMVEVLAVPVQPAWLVEIGRLEALRLSRPREGVAKLREAVALNPSRVDSSLALADTLSSMGAHEEAASELRAFFASIDPATLDSDKVATIAAMTQRELEASNRSAQALVAEELMAFLGYGAPSRLQFLRSRVLPESLPRPAALERTTLERAIIPAQAQGPLLRIAGALEEIGQKLLRIEPAGVGATSAMRLVSRSSHPMRLLADRLSRAFGSIAFDLYVEVPALTSPRCLPGSPPSILLPPGFEKLPINEQAAGLSRLLTFLALGIPWIEEVANEDLVGWVFGALAVGRPGWDGGGLHPTAESLASQWRPLIHKAISRKSRRMLDEIAEEASLHMDPVSWRHAMRLAAWRCAFIVTGDWTSTFLHAWRLERDLAGIQPDRVAFTIFGHSVLRELTLWGLSPETSPLLRATGHPT